MTPEERLTELAAALATGYLRLLSSRQKALAQGARAEALCDLAQGGNPAAGKEAT
jgi:hypothetical protein